MSAHTHAPGRVELAARADTRANKYHPALVLLHWLLAWFIIASLLFGFFVLRVVPNTDPRTQLVKRVGEKLVRQLPTDHPWKFNFHLLNIQQVTGFAIFRSQPQHIFRTRTRY